MTISTLNQLILDTAGEVARGRGSASLTECDALIVLDDPDGALGDWGLRWLAEKSQGGLPARHLVAASRNFVQVSRLEGKAQAFGVEDRVLTLRTQGIDIGPDMVDALLRVLGTRDSDRMRGVAGRTGLTLAIGHLPKARAELDFLSRSLAIAGVDAIIAGENNKHMTRSMNSVLDRAWGSVRASRGRGKFRCLIAEQPREGVEPAPVAQRQGGAPLGICPSADGPQGVGSEPATVFGVGGVFSGAQADLGGDLLARMFLENAERNGETTGNILDLGCGNGSVSRAVLDCLPLAHIVATDVDADAVASAQLTLESHLESGRALVLWDDAGASLPSQSFDAVLLNPPFHDGSKVDATLAQGLIDAARRLLKPSAPIYLVHNSHLRYRYLLDETLSNVTELVRTDKFTVLRAER